MHTRINTTMLLLRLNFITINIIVCLEMQTLTTQKRMIAFLRTGEHTKQMIFYHQNRQSYEHNNTNKEIIWPPVQLYSVIVCHLS